MTDAPPAEVNVEFRQSSYRNYIDWKGWEPFTYGPDEAESFRGELGRADLTGLSVLEIGFGAGNFLAWALDRGARVAGTEMNTQCREIAEARGVELLPVELGEAVEGNQDRFDYVIAFDVLEHMTLPQIAATLNHCAALLMSDGLLVLRFPNAQSPFGLAPYYGDVTHVTALSGDQLVQLAAASPLEIVAVRRAFRPRGSTIGRKLVRGVRYLLQDLIGALIRFSFASTAPVSPNVIVTLRRRRVAAGREGAA